MTELNMNYSTLIFVFSSLILVFYSCNFQPIWNDIYIYDDLVNS